MVFTKIGDWKAARHFPRTYPGDRPDQSYLLLNDNIHLLFWEDRTDIYSAYFLDEEDRRLYINETLKSMKLPTMAQRFPVLAYGANRNPATLSIKFSNYNYKSTGKGLATPVIKGLLHKADVVAANIYGQGYLYADLLFESQLTTDTQVEAWLTLLDSDQLRVINDSEGLKNRLYTLGRFPGYVIESTGQVIAPLGYAGNNKIFISPQYQNPLAFSTVAAENRTLPELQPVSMLDHLIDVFDLRDQIASITGIDNDEALSEELAMYLNGQWWYWFNTMATPIRGYQKVLELFKECIGGSSRNVSTTEYLRKKKLVLPERNWYLPGDAFTLRGLLNELG